MNQFIEWAKDNYLIVIFAFVYAIANFYPRPHPDTMVGFQKKFWQIIDRLCILTAEKMPGNLKFILLDSPEIKKEQPKVDVDLKSEEEKSEEEEEKK